MGEVAGRVHIWSGEHRAWWRANGRGYTDQVTLAGSYTRQEAERIAADCGPEKMLEIQTPVAALLLAGYNRPRVPVVDDDCDDGERYCTCQWASNASGEVGLWPAELDPFCAVHVGNGLADKLDELGALAAPSSVLRSTAGARGEPEPGGSTDGEGA